MLTEEQIRALLNPFGITLEARQIVKVIAYVELLMRLTLRRFERRKSV
jgi:hypothetical protein